MLLQKYRSHYSLWLVVISCSVGLINFLIERSILVLLFWLSLETNALVIQASILGFFTVSLLDVCSFPFSCAYKAQYCQGQGSCKGKYAKQLADTCGYMCAKMAHATAPRRDCIATMLVVLSRVQ